MGGEFLRQFPRSIGRLEDDECVHAGGGDPALDAETSAKVATCRFEIECRLALIGADGARRTALTSHAIAAVRAASRHHRIGEAPTMSGGEASFWSPPHPVVNAIGTLRSFTSPITGVFPPLDRDEGRLAGHQTVADAERDDLAPCAARLSVLLL